MLSGTEADIINTVARLRDATKNQIRRNVGFSLEYIGHLCRYLVRKGYLTFANGYYSLAEEGIKTLLNEEVLKIDRELLKEFKGKVTPLPSERYGIKIRTNFEFPVEDESLALKSNINKIGLNLKREKSDINGSVKLFKEIQKRRKG